MSVVIETQFYKYIQFFNMITLSKLYGWSQVDLQTILTMNFKTSIYNYHVSLHILCLRETCSLGSTILQTDIQKTKISLTYSLKYFQRVMHEKKKSQNCWMLLHYLPIDLPFQWQTKQEHNSSGSSYPVLFPPWCHISVWKGHLFSLLQRRIAALSVSLHWELSYKEPVVIQLLN